MLSKMVLLLVFATYSFNIFANDINLFLKQNSICQKELSQYVTNNVANENGEWRGTFPDNVLFEAIRFHPTKLGQWYEIQGSAKKVLIRKYNGENFKQFSFNSKCELIEDKFELPKYLSDLWYKKSKIDFDDKQLKNTISDGKKRIFYLWSPTFSYSVEFYPYAEEYSKLVKAEFIPLLAPEVSLVEARNALKQSYSEYFKKRKMHNTRILANENEIVKNFAVDFYLRFGYSHYPVMYLSKNGKIHPRWITGVMTKKGFVHFSNELFAGIK